MARRKASLTMLVTGAAGFIGSHLVEALLARGFMVVGFDNLSTGTTANLRVARDQAAFAFIEGDIRDRAAVKGACAGVDVVFHLAAVTSVTESMRAPDKYQAVNVMGTHNVLMEAVSVGVKRIVFASSAAVYGTPPTVPIPEDAPLHPLSPYGASKVAAEAACTHMTAKNKILIPILRFFNIYGPRQSGAKESGVVSRFISQAQHKKPLIIYGDGHQTRDFIFINDVVETLIRAGTVAKIPTIAINIGTGEATSILQLATTVQQIIPTSQKDLIFKPPRAGDIRHSVGKIERMLKLLHYSPQYDLHSGLLQTCTP